MHDSYPSEGRRVGQGAVLALASDFVGYSDLFPPKANAHTGTVPL